ncbi:MAG TPA: hypothetical protein VL947_02070, partial [Cytophagales bacterium]|nr:hypothetical protein [Cytophagales bacterium]
MLHSQNFAIKIVPKIKNDSLYIAYVLSFNNFPTLAPTVGQVRIVTSLNESSVDLDKGIIRRVSRYDLSNPTSGTHYRAAELIHDGVDRSTYLITRNINPLLSPYYLANVNNDTLGIVSYPIKQCFSTLDIEFDTRGSLQTEIRTWAMNDVANGVDLVDFDNGQPIPKENVDLRLSSIRLCNGGVLKIGTQAVGTNYELSIIRNGSVWSTKTSTTPEFVNLRAGNDFIDNDRFVISYRSPSGCPESTVTKSISVGNCCDSSFTELDDEYCVAGFSKKLIPVSPGGTFTGPGVHYSPLLQTWVFSPKAAGPGTHTITYVTPTSTSGTCRGQSSSQSIVVSPVPCKATISNVMSNLTIPSPNGIYTNCDGEIFIASSDKHAIFKIDTFGVKTVYAGDTIPSLARDGNVSDPIQANRPTFCQPIGIVGNLNGDLFIADGGTQSIIMIAKSGTVTTIGGFLRDTPTLCGSNPSLSVNGSRGTSRFNDVYGVALNATEDTLFVSESKGNKISGIELLSGNYNSFLVAGSGASPLQPLNGSATTATFKTPQHMSVSGKYLYVADFGNNMIRRIDLKASTVITLAGKFKKPSDPKSRIDVDTSLALLDQPSAVTADCEGNAYVVEPGNNWVLRVNHANNTMMVTRFAGDEFGQPGDTYNTFNTPQALSIYTKGFIDVADYKNNRIVRLAIDDWSNNVFKDVDTVYCKSTTKDTLIPVKCSGSLSCVEDPSLIATTTMNGQLAYTFSPSKVGTFTLRYTYISGRCTQSISKLVKVVEGRKPDLGRDLSFCDQSLKIDIKNGVFASYEWKRDNVAAGVPNTQAYLMVTQMTNNTSTISVTTKDEFGCLDSDQLIVTKAAANFPNVAIQSSVNSDELCYGQTTTLFAVFTPSTDAPKYLKSWNTNNLGDTTTQVVANATYKYVFTIADRNSPNCTKTFEKNIKIRDLPQACYRLTNSASGLEIPIDRYKVSTLPNMTEVVKPLDVVYRNGDLYITVVDAVNQIHKIKKYTVKTGLIVDYVGAGAPGFSDSLAPLSTKLNTPSSIAFDSKGNLFICNMGGNYISKYDLSANKVYVVAGAPGVSGFNDGEGQSALFNKPTHIEVDVYDNVYVTDNLNNAVRKLSPIAGKTT